MYGDTDIDTPVVDVLTPAADGFTRPADGPLMATYAPRERLLSSLQYIQGVGRFWLQCCCARDLLMGGWHPADLKHAEKVVDEIYTKRMALTNQMGQTTDPKAYVQLNKEYDELRARTLAEEAKRDAVAALLHLQSGFGFKERTLQPAQTA